MDQGRHAQHDPDAALPITEAARIRRIPPRRIRTAIFKGELPAYQIGVLRVRLRELDAWIDSRRYPSSSERAS
jgi:hypothetical protein